MIDYIDDTFINPRDRATAMNAIISASYQQEDLNAWTPEVEIFARSLCLAFGFTPEALLPQYSLKQETSILVCPTAAMLEDKDNDSN